MLSYKGGVSNISINVRFGTITISKTSGEIEFKMIRSEGGLTSNKLATLENASRAGGEKSVS